MPTLLARRSLRVLDKRNLKVKLEDLGFRPEQRWPSRTCSKEPARLVLVTGPTGPGKTTTLYSLDRSARLRVNITVEDPVEYQLDLGEPGSGCRSRSVRFVARAAERCAQDP